MDILATARPPSPAAAVKTTDDDNEEEIDRADEGRSRKETFTMRSSQTGRREDEIEELWPS